MFPALSSPPYLFRLCGSGYVALSLPVSYVRVLLHKRPDLSLLVPLFVSFDRTGTMIRFPLLLALAALTLAACDSTDPASPPDVDDLPPAEVDLLPLDIGNRWITEVIEAEPDGTVTERTADTLTVVRDTVVAGERWFKIEGSRRNRSIPGGWYTNRKNGVWKSSADTSVADPYLMYAYPADQGATYAIPGRQGFTVTVADTAFTAEISNGAFSGYLYEWDTEEAFGFTVAEGAGRLDRVLIPGVGFGFIGCGYLGPRENEELVLTKRLD